MSILSTVGSILSTVGVFVTVEGYLENRGGYSFTWRYHDSRRDIMSTMGCSVLLYEYPYGTENPAVLMISFTVLNIPHGTQDIPHSTEHPPQY